MDETKYDFVKMQKKLKKYIDGNRFQHTLGVMYTAASMAMVYGCSLEQAQAAGLLHDCAKNIPGKEKIKLCQKNRIKISPLEMNNPYLLHGKLGAHLAKTKYGIQDEAVLNAIIWHTTGTSDMTTLEKIVYIADYIEPHRYKAPRLKEIRKLAFMDLDECMYAILEDSVSYLKKDPSKMDPATMDAYMFYKKVHMEKLQQEGDS